ncbi:MAG: efflux RND transporter periplasmic adaptor subunit [Desulfobacterales bacterium]|nr:efflux RND transporter periplasmic adaptor subunit [Desulfobacterales bacterium]MDD3082266.1 efflux RND transporter periplasmic adaptor subunit [Desulfobacterales bacterium]MDD3951302.1 efflux RND transporter periplasmic adaptor subunit [Desulfobacterales bacterium]
MDRINPTGRSRHIRFLIAGMILTASFLCPSCSSEKKSSTPPPPDVTVLEVIRKDVPVVFEYVAQTQSSHLVNIQARVTGFLDRCLYTEGAVVNEGQVLFQMDAKPFQVQLAQAKATLARQEAAFETARLSLARTKPLTEQDALSQKDLDDATGHYQSAAAAVEEARAKVETARLNLSYTTITSPITGISSSARQTEGTYINPQNSLLTTVSALSPIWVNFSLSENEMQRFRNQVATGLLRVPEAERFIVEVVLVDGSIHPYTGRMTFAEPSYNPQTGTFAVRASVDNPGGVLRPNQYVRARLKGAVRPETILVPQKAVQQGSKSHFVWVVDRENKVEQRPVTVGEWHEDDWFIPEGLRSGERVVIDGGLMLRPGMTVSVKPDNSGQESEPPAASEQN